jgi:hypothetical protein
LTTEEVRMASDDKPKTAKQAAVEVLHEAAEPLKSEETPAVSWR